MNQTWMGKKITALTAQKRNPRRVNLYLDGEFAFGLERIVAAWLHVGQELSDERIASLQAEDSREAAYQKALRFISHRERTEAEIQQYLKEQRLPEEITGEVVERLRQSGLVNDQRFAQAWVENRSEFRPRSRRALAYELRQKGVDPDSIQEALDGVEDSALAYEAALKQARKFELLDWPEFRQKMYAFLARRGFSYGTAAEVVSRVWDEIQSQRTKDENFPDEYSSDQEVGL